MKQLHQLLSSMDKQDKTRPSMDVSNMVMDKSAPVVKVCSKERLPFKSKNTHYFKKLDEEIKQYVTWALLTENELLKHARAAPAGDRAGDQIHQGQGPDYLWNSSRAADRFRHFVHAEGGDSAGYPAPFGPGPGSKEPAGRYEGVLEAAEPAHATRWWAVRTPALAARAGASAEPRFVLPVQEAELRLGAAPARILAVLRPDVQLHIYVHILE